MRKAFFLLSISLVILCIAIQPVRAHISGAFQDFFVGLSNEESTKELEETIANTKDQHAALSQKTAVLKEEFEDEQVAMMNKLTFYDSVAFDTYASFILDNKEMVDVMANNKIMQQQIDKDLEALESLYNQYQSLQLALSSVEGYQDLLDEIQKNDAKKQNIVAIFPNLLREDKAQFASLLQLVWNEDMAKVDEFLEEDAKKLSENLLKWAKESGTNGIRNLEGTTINKHASMRYLIQKDHIYIAYENGDGHVILISTLAKHPDKKYAYQLEIEAGFLNGFAVSQAILDELSGKFVIDYHDLVSENEPDWLIQNGSNSFILQPSTTVMD